MTACTARTAVNKPIVILDAKPLRQQMSSLLHKLLLLYLRLRESKRQKSKKTIVCQVWESVGLKRLLSTVTDVLTTVAVVIFTGLQLPGQSAVLHDSIVHHAVQGGSNLSPTVNS